MTANCAAPKTVAAVKAPAKKVVTARVRKTPKFKIQLDERIKGMTVEALDCRSMGHAWNRVPMESKRRLELLARAETETIRICARCRSRRVDVYELPSFYTISSQIEYSEGYLIAREFKGSGRMPRHAAVAASIVAEVPELLAL